MISWQALCTITKSARGLCGFSQYVVFLKHKQIEWKALSCLSKQATGVVPSLCKRRKHLHFQSFLIFGSMLSCPFRWRLVFQDMADVLNENWMMFDDKRWNRHLWPYRFIFSAWHTKCPLLLLEHSTKTLAYQYSKHLVSLLHCIWLPYKYTIHKKWMSILSIPTDTPLCPIQPIRW